MSPAAESLFFPNGLDARTGRPARPPVRAVELAGWAHAWTRQQPVPAEDGDGREEDVFRRLPFGVDAGDLTATGWALVVPQGADPAVVDALRPLVARRCEQAEGLYEDPIVVGRNEEVDDLFRRLEVSPHEAQPGELPYHLLIVASPEEISYGFQQVLSQGRSVGRLHLASTADYRAYAEKVVAAEERLQRGRPEIAWFAADNGDPATERTLHELVKPLAGEIADRLPWWRCTERLGAAATKQSLRSLFADAAPHLLFTASHGVAPTPGEGGQEEVAGALVTSDWPGEGRGVAWGPECYLAAADLPPELAAAGGVAFLFACFSGGTPQTDGYWFKSGDAAPERLVERPFVSRLAQGLLARPGGPAAVIAHVDRAWTCSFSWHRGGQTGAYRDTLLSLMDGQPVGQALDWLWEVHRVSASRLLEMTNRRDAGQEHDPQLLVRYWLAANDARNFVVCGDPAVRLPIA